MFKGMRVLSGRGRQMLGSGLLGLALGAGTVNGQLAVPTAKELSQLALLSDARLKKQPARWDVDVVLPGATFALGILSAHPDFEVRVMVKPPRGRPKRLARIVQHKDDWYVEEQNGLAGVYRAWEAPVNMEFLISLLSESWPVPYLPGKGHSVRRITKEKVAKVGIPLDAAQTAEAHQFLERAKELEEKPPKELAASIEEVKRRLKFGNEIEVDAKNGFLQQVTVGELTLRFSPIRWLPQETKVEVPAKLPNKKKPRPENRDRQIMIDHAGAWRPGNPRMETGCRLLDLKTGVLERLPFVAGICSPGCFLKDRSKVVVPGRKVGGERGLYLVDLNTGSNRRLAADTLDGGVCFRPVLSPDGKKLVLEYLPAGNDSRHQVMELDLDTDKVTRVGDDLGVHSLSWLPDDQGWLAVRPGDEKNSGKVVTINRKGEVEELFEAEFAQLIGEKSDRVFHQAPDGVWRIADLSGENAKAVGKGLAKLSLPTVNSEGTEAIMMAFVPDAGPSPVLVDLESGVVRPLRVGAGLWMSPAWR